MSAPTLHGRNIVITGGSSGIGLYMAREFARHGANLVLVARDPARLQTAQTELAQLGVEVLAFSCDVTDAQGLAACFEEAADRLGAIHGVVANSGYCHPGYFAKTRPEDLARQVEVNLTGCMFTLRLGLPWIIAAGGGFLALTSSPAGSASIFGFAGYGATKAALNYLSHVLRAEHARHNITVHLLLPPDTKTPGYEHEAGLYPPETQALLSGGQLHSPEAVARTFVEGILRGRRTITVGFASRAAIGLARYCPWAWEWYAHRKTSR